MSEHFDRAYALAVDTLTFAAAMIALLFCLAAGIRHLSAVEKNTGNQAANRTNMETSEIYLGRKEYDGTVFQGETFLTKDSGDYVTRAGLYEELQKMPENIRILIGGEEFANGTGTEHYVNGKENIRYFIEVNTLGDIAVLRLHDVFLREYETDENGQITVVKYTGA